MKLFKAITTTLSITILISLLIGGVYVSYVFGGYPLDELKNHFRYGVGDIKYDEGDWVDSGDLPIYDVPPPERGELLNDNDIVNILLIGSDAITSKERGRSDSIMIATIDMKHKKLKMTSILRDTYAFLPGKDSKGRDYGWSKINNAYSYGDAAFLIETIEHNFKIKLDYYINVNFELFKRIIERIGGVNINLSEQEAKYLRERSEGGPNRHKVKAGMNKLDGYLALEFARARNAKAGPFKYINNEGKEVTVSNDFARSARQRHVLERVFDEMKDESAATLVKIAEECMKHTRTNIPAKQLASFVHSVMSMDQRTIHQMQIPYSGLYEDKVVSSGAQVLFLSQQNMEANTRKIREFIFEE